MTLHKPLYPDSPEPRKTVAVCQPEDAMAFLVAARSLALRNIQITLADSHWGDQPFVTGGVCRECLRGSSAWLRIPHAATCQTGNVLRLYDDTRDRLARPELAWTHPEQWNERGAADELAGCL